MSSLFPLVLAMSSLHSLLHLHFGRAVPISLALQNCPLVLTLRLKLLVVPHVVVVPIVVLLILLFFYIEIGCLCREKLEWAQLALNEDEGVGP